MVQVISTEKGVSMGGGLSVSSMGVLALKISVDQLTEQDQTSEERVQ